ncbi:MAG: hypothetical protein R3F39_23740 [Myxococcota bacterium]
MNPRHSIVTAVLGAALGLSAAACDDGSSTAGDTSAPDSALVADTAQGSDGVADTTPDVAVDAAPDAVADASPEVAVDAAPDAVADAAPDAVADTAPDAVADTTADATPDVTPDAVGGVTCPPPAPTGFTVGQRISDLAFVDCDGKAVSFHGACGAPATLIFNYYGW